MDFVKSKFLGVYDKSGAAVPPTQLSGKVVALYFSAHWCPPCRAFTPVLKNFYEEVKKSGGPFEILFVSADKSEQEGKEYFASAHGNWLMTEFAQTQAVSKAFDVKGFPTLVVIDSGGKPIAMDARSQVQTAVQGGPQAIMQVFTEWQKQCGDWRESKGTTLGGGHVASDKDAMRAARMARLGGGPALAAATPTVSTPAPTHQPAESPPVVGPVGATSTVPPAAELTSLAQLIAMGFESDKAEQALAAADGNVETAAALLLES